MSFNVTAPASRLRVLLTRGLGRLGFGDDAFLLLLAAIIGVVTGVAAVGFHELINFIRDMLYGGIGPTILYGKGMVLLLVLPAAGGLAVGVISQYVFHTREGHGIVDVVESVVRTSGFQKPTTAIEKILTSALTIGSGGSAGAEGPIVQIGAAIANAVGQLFQVSRQYMPTLIGCGAAAGISAIFNAPFGGVLFTLEVILQDFSIRLFTPIVLASVIAQVTTLGVFQFIGRPEEHRAIFAMPAFEVTRHSLLNFGQVPNFILLGIVCGIVGLSLTRLTYQSENLAHRIPVPRALRPAFGGALLGVGGVFYILVFGRLLLGTNKPFGFASYPMPAFFGDGYGVIQQLLGRHYYDAVDHRILLLLLFLIFAKILGTVVTLSSGGSGGIIAPSVFLGGATGAIVGFLLRQTGWFQDLQPELYALVGMGAVLAAVVHAPLASILICFELTQDYKVMLPAMLACTLATGVARVIYPESIYTLTLRKRGIHIGAGSDLSLLRRIGVEQVTLEPASFVNHHDPLQKLIDLTLETNIHDFVVTDEHGVYEGMVYSQDVKTVLFDRDALPVLVVSDVTRRDVEPVRTTDDLASVLSAFTRHDVSHLPVAVPGSATRIVGVISRAGLMRRYQGALQEA